MNRRVVRVDLTGEPERTRMRRLTKRYRTAVEIAGYEKHRQYSLPEALVMLGKFPKAKFDETVELHCRLGIDPKKSDQMVRGSISLPRGIGKSKSVIVFAEGASGASALAFEEIRGILTWYLVGGLVLLAGLAATLRLQR